jgi:hypothetical protein
VKKAPPGWRHVTGGNSIERYRYALGNGRTLIVVKVRPGRWYYGEMADDTREPWKPAGCEPSKLMAMDAALRLAAFLEAMEEEGAS